MQDLFSLESEQNGSHRMSLELQDRLFGLFSNRSPPYYERYHMGKKSMSYRRYSWCKWGAYFVLWVTGTAFEVVWVVGSTRNDVEKSLLLRINMELLFPVTDSRVVVICFDAAIFGSNVLFFKVARSHYFED